MSKKLILASASPRRLELLATLGITPDSVVATDIDETPRKKESPRAYVKRMAHEKAVAGMARSDTPEGAFVLAADTIVVARAAIVGKPADAKEARRMLRMLSGRRHRVLTAIALGVAKDDIRARVVESIVGFARFDDAALAAYIESGEWQGKAGGYGIQGRAAGFVKSLRGSHSAVVGLPLYEVTTLLQSVGYKLS